MRSKIVLFLLLFTVTFFGFAGEKNKSVGLLFKTGSMSNVGAVFHVSDRVSLRTTLGFGGQDADIESTSLLQRNYKQDTRDFNAALGLFYHFREKEKLSLYSGLELGYNRSVIETSGQSFYQIIDGVVIVNSTAIQEKEKRYGYTGSVILGVKYRLGKKFAIFGEVGFGIESFKTDDKNEGVTLYDAEYTSWNLKRSGIGIVFYI